LAVVTLLMKFGRHIDEGVSCSFCVLPSITCDQNYFENYSSSF
jgi:hypothetical protein